MNGLALGRSVGFWDDLIGVIGVHVDLKKNLDFFVLVCRGNEIFKKTSKCVRNLCE